MSRPVGRPALFRSRLRRFTRMLPGIGAGDPRAVHRARVASRRLRELLPLLQLDGHAAQKLGKRLRKVTRWLGGARELDAILTLLDGDLGTATPQAQGRLRSALGARRDQARARLDRRLAWRLLALLRPVLSKVILLIALEALLVSSIFLRPWFLREVIDNGIFPHFDLRWCLWMG